MWFFIQGKSSKGYYEAGYVIDGAPGLFLCVREMMEDFAYNTDCVMLASASAELLPVSISGSVARILGECQNWSTALIWDTPILVPTRFSGVA